MTWPTLTSYLEAPAAERTAMVAAFADAVSDRFALHSDSGGALLPSFVDRVSGLEFRLVAGGTFRMGLSQEEEASARKLCDPIPANLPEMRPTHDVKVEPFLMSRTPVLNEVAVGILPSYQPYKGRLKHPAFLSREDVMRVVTALECRLPREEEMEYACRANTRTLFVFGDTLPPESELQRWLRLDFSDPAAVQANPFDLLGMFTGEWCADEFRETYDPGARVESGSYAVRGGGAYFWPWQDQEWVWCMSAMRMPSKDLADGTCGFRLVYDIPA